MAFDVDFVQLYNVIYLFIHEIEDVKFPFWLDVKDDPFDILRKRMYE